MKPLGDRVIVRRLEEKKDSTKIIELPDNVKEKPLEGEVISLGLKVADPNLKSGKRVLFGKYAGTEVKIKNEDLLILREEEILAML